MDKPIDPKVKMIMTQAIREAKEHDDNRIKPEHVILSMMIDNDNECVQALNLMGVDTFDLYDKISDFTRKNDLNSILNPTNDETIPRIETNSLLFIP